MSALHNSSGSSFVGSPGSPFEQHANLRHNSAILSSKVLQELQIGVTHQLKLEQEQVKSDLRTNA